jgi:hypothetical protein
VARQSELEAARASLILIALERYGPSEELDRLIEMIEGAGAGRPAKLELAGEGLPSVDWSDRDQVSEGMRPIPIGSASLAFRAYLAAAALCDMYDDAGGNRTRHDPIEAAKLRAEVKALGIVAAADNANAKKESGGEDR